MKSRVSTLLIVSLVLLSMTLGLGYAQGPKFQGDIGTAFGYQGRLNAGGNPAEGAYDFEFRLYDAVAGGSQVGGTVAKNAVAVSRGLFSVDLDFGGAAFTGQARWLEIAVKGPGEAAFTPLSPRQALMPTPYALYAATAPWTSLVGIPAGFADGVDNDTTYAAGTGLTLAGGQFSVNFAGTGSANTAARSDHTHPAGAYWSLTGNAGTDPAINFIGTTDPVSLTLAVSGTAALRLEPTDGTPNLIGGNPENRASGEGATIGGGGTALRVVIGARGSYWRYEPNEALGDFSTVSGGLSNKTLGYAAAVGGGEGNLAAGSYSTVGGGGGTRNDLYYTWGNTATGVGATIAGGVGNIADGAYSAIGGGLGNETSADHATIGGGGEPTPYSPPIPPDDWRPRWGNHVTDEYGTIGGGGKNVAGDSDGDPKSAVRATVGGGWDNIAGGESSTVAGGELNVADGGFSAIGGGVFNQASGVGATVPGGGGNSAAGNYSFAAGYGAKALHDGSFVWADSTDADFGSTADNQFLVRASGGAQISAGNGVTLTVGLNSALRLLESNSIGGLILNTVSEGVEGATIGGGGDWMIYDRWFQSYPHWVMGNYATIGGGLTNEAFGWASTVAGGEGNYALADYATIGGGGGPPDTRGVWLRENTASGMASTISGGQGNIAQRSHSTVGGGRGNVAAGEYATIGGGGGDPYVDAGNRVSDDYGTVGGGGNNQAGDDAGTSEDRPYATVGGGFTNTASGDGSVVAGGVGNVASGLNATIAGGNDNTASGERSTVGGGKNNRALNSAAVVGGGISNTANGWGATVAGGNTNNATQHYAAVGGGASNTASGTHSTIPGGYMNTAQGAYSFAAGRKAKANNQGCFVWGDSTDADIACNTNNTWIARATGGVYFYTNTALTSGVRVVSGASAWSSVSDRTLKENFDTANGQDILKRLSTIPITTWNYKAQDASIRHIGPVAQDFYAAFGLGEDETLISTIDADGVALAAIQGLYGTSQSQASRIQQLEKENATQKQEISDLEARIAALETMVAKMAQTGAGGGR